jgi:hypothetical protein
LKQQPNRVTIKHREVFRLGNTTSQFLINYCSKPDIDSISNRSLPLSSLTNRVAKQQHDAKGNNPTHTHTCSHIHECKDQQAKKHVELDHLQVVSEAPGTEGTLLPGSERRPRLNRGQTESPFSRRRRIHARRTQDKQSSLLYLLSAAAKTNRWGLTSCSTILTP